MMRRPWEKYWEATIDEKTFLRNSKHEVHPVRDLIAMFAADYDTVFEGGCATAVDLPLHVKRGTDYIGLDITEKFISEARELYIGYDLRVGTVMDIPLGDGFVDTAYVKAVLEHLHPLEWVLAVRELWRIARRQVILALFHWDPDRRKAPILERMAADDSDRSMNVGNVQAFNNRISLLDVHDVLFELGATSWNRYMVGGKMNNTTKFKPYMVYVVKKQAKKR